MEDVFRNQIGRVVAFVLTPILLPAVGAGAVWLQDNLGVNLNPTETVGYLVAVVAGLALVVFQWLKNRGEWEKAVATVQQVHAQGSGVVPVSLPIDEFDEDNELGGVNNPGNDAELPKNPEAVKDK